MRISAQYLLFTLVPLTEAAVPTKAGQTLIWSDDFNGAAGASPSTSNWNWEVKYPNSNWNEQQHYRTDRSNSALSGKGSLRITPTKVGNTWYSARMTGKKDLQCPPGKTMTIEAEIRMGNNPESKQAGIWPAFWAIGSSFRAATNPSVWPMCGEWDIVEGRNGNPTNFGSLHCDKAPGGICNEYVGIGAQIGYTKGKFHKWSFTVDRRITDNQKWQQQSLTWALDGVVYKTITGKDLGDFATWQRVARSPFFLIMNIAVGGDFPGPPNAQTVGGIESGMEVN